MTPVKRSRSRGAVDLRFIEGLEVIAGKSNVITAADALLNYGNDEAPLLKPVLPAAAVKPADTASVSSIMKLARLRHVPVTVRGGGTGLSGGCQPLPGGLVLSLENMKSIIEIDTANFMAVVQPGVTLGDLKSAVEAQGLSYPVALGEMTATVGGSIATNAGGLNAVKYGVTRHHVLGLEAVLAGGEVIRTGGKLVKCSSGYDLTQLLIGSEGTLAVITEITLKLDTRPPCREVLLVPFNSLQDAIGCVPAILRLGRLPVGLEFMEKSIIEIAESYTGITVPYHEHESFLLIIMEGDSMEEIHRYFAEIEKVVMKGGAAGAYVPPGQLAAKRLLEVREKFYHALNKAAPMQMIDAVVPRSEIARFVSAIKQLEAKYGIPIIVYGHAGDGNVHLHPVCKGMSLRAWLKKLPGLTLDIYRAGLAMGGAVSGEHGIGADKKKYFQATSDRALLRAMKNIKKALDPEDILNPGKIFD